MAMDCVLVSTMFQEFSEGYYLGQLYVEPHDGEKALLHEEYHERANEHVFVGRDGVERLDYPLVMKLDTAHFPVHAGTDVPSATLAVPDAVLEHARIEDPPALKQVLLAKQGWATRLVEWFGAGPLDGGFKNPQ